MSTLGGWRAGFMRTCMSAYAEIRETISAQDKATRALTWATATMCLGTGLFYAVSAIFYSTVIGLSAAQIGLGLAFAGIAGIIGALAGGYVAAYFGSRRTLVAALVLQGVLIACYTLAGNMIAFAILASAIVLVRFTGTTARAALIATSFTGPDRVRIRARMRVVTNVATGLGALLGGVALTIGTATAFMVAVVAVGVLILLSALPMCSVRARVRFTDTAPTVATDAPPSEPARPESGTVLTRPDPRRIRVRSPFADPRYLAVAFLVGVNATYFAMVEIGLPLWVTQHTAAPNVMVSILLATNAVVIVLTQVPVSRGTHDVRTAGRAAFRGAALIAASCLVFALSGSVGLAATTALLLLGALLMSGGEAFGEAGAWGLTMELADPNNQPRYQGVAEMAYAGGQTVGPLLISATALSHGTWGWLTLAGMFVASGGGLYLLSRRGLVIPPVESVAG
jgi:MFS family permease